MRNQDRPSVPAARAVWAVIALALATVLFFMATSDIVYELTSPPAFSWHVVLRKFYSIVAFALVGFTADRALGPAAKPALRASLLVAGYSAVIEIAQFEHGSKEGLGWNAVDVVCGAVGGWLGIASQRLIARVVAAAR